MKKIIFLFVLFVFLFGCASTKETKNEIIIENKTIEGEAMAKKNEMKEYDSIGAFLAENNVLGKQLEIEVYGEELKSTFGNLSCVYFESGKFYDDGSYRFRNSEEQFHIIIEGKFKVAVEQKGGALRLFISTSTFERQFKDKDKAGREVDYCLQKGKKYYMVIGSEGYEYGPPDESGKRATSGVTYIEISDKEFKNGKPQVEQTPTVKNWIYG
ncbi:hypothetical protein J4450_04765 [Candidatus Micrarchaeota archaeon]|nr:hypothetical protein [Candidatus Micrarchaeota archaeon]